MKTTAATVTSTPDHELIARLAYAAWQRDGCPHGKDMEYWLQAEQQFTATQRLLAQELKCHRLAMANSRSTPHRRNRATKQLPSGNRDQL